jgi:hypothetical protein
MSVCHVPLEPGNAAGVAAAFGGAYVESKCPPMQSCTDLHVRYTADGGVATWSECELDRRAAGVALALAAAAVVAVVVVRRRAAAAADAAGGLADAAALTRRAARR